MSPISDDQISRYHYVLLDEDATVLDAVRALHDADGADWWCLLVQQAGGRYAAGPFSQLAQGLGAAGEPYLHQPLHTLVGSDLQEVVVLADQEAADFDAVLSQVADASCPIAVITRQGDVHGVVMAPTTRRLRAAGAFDSGLLQLAGKYATLPDKGLLGPDAPSKPQKKRSDTRRPRRPGR